MVPHNLDPELEAASEALRDFYLRSHRLVDRRMSGEGVSFARAKVLMLIAREGAMRSTDVASFFGYAPRTVTEAIDGLERDGLVRREPDPADRRAKRIVLTPAGEAAAIAAGALRIAFINDVFSALSAEECETLVGLLGKLNARLGELGG
jgi:DNA-binding MarR family transcriptional regulator